MIGIPLPAWALSKGNIYIYFQVTESTDKGVTVRFMESVKGDIQQWTWPDTLQDYFYEKGDPSIVLHLPEPEIREDRRQKLVYVFSGLKAHKEL